MRDRGLSLAWRLSLRAFQVVATIAAIGALAGWNPAAWILVGAVAALVSAHVATGLILYRRTMRRPWPAVQPLPDDDDW